MNNIQPKRFDHVLKYEFATGLRPMLWNALGMLMLYLFIFYFMASFTHMEGERDLPKAILSKGIADSMGSMSFVVFIIYALATAARSFRKEQKKQTRTSMLMLPASNLEKFLGRLTYTVVYTAVCGFAAFVVADLIHVVWISAKGWPTYWALSFFSDTGLKVSIFGEFALWAACCGMIAFYLFFLLGGVFFKRYHVVLTFIAGILLRYIFTNAIWAIDSLFNTSDNLLILSPTSRILYSVLSLLGAALFLFLAYRLFCRWQIVTHKFANV